jgi:3-methyladenine DNA glycosylase AlkD
MSNLNHVNNWDLVDLSAPNIVGVYLLEHQKNTELLYTLCKSPVVWERRISILSTLTFIRANQFEDCLKVSGLLLADGHDLIHKAVGWMLREVGKK